jgi:hypothetical protein
MATSLKQGADMTRDHGWSDSADRDSNERHFPGFSDFMAMDPKHAEDLYPRLDSAKWGKEGMDRCRRNILTLNITLKCNQFNHRTVELVKLKSKWCRKSEHFCDFKTGIFAELNHVNTGGENVFLAGMEAESHVPRSTTQPPAAVPARPGRSRLNPNHFPFRV